MTTSLLISFGQAHVHKIGDNIFHKNVLCKLVSPTGLSHKELREKAFDLFGQKWSFSYPAERAEDPAFNSHFPLGIIEVEV